MKVHPKNKFFRVFGDGSPTTVRLKPAELLHCEEIGRGSAENGLRILVQRSMKARRTTRI
jgi:hypothetical protein